MTTMMAPASSQLVAALLAQRENAVGESAWVRELRAQAASCAGAMRLPTPRDEAWRFTDLSALREASFLPAPRQPIAIAAGELAPWVLPEAARRRMVFVDGLFAPELSDLSALGDGIAVRSLAQEQPAHLEGYLARHATFRQDVFPALNAACWLDGAVIEVSSRHVDESPLHLLFVSTGRQGAIALNPRCLVIQEPNSRLTLVEDYVSLGDDAALTNSVTELFLAADAELRHVKLQRQATTSFWLGTTAVSLGRAARYRSVAIALGARLSRHDLRVEQAGVGGEVTLDGLAVVAAGQVADTHSVLDHAFPAGVSQQRHKAVVGGNGRAVFNGRVVVRPAAQQTHSTQASRNLLLSAKARLDTKPQLEIFADDVRCTHGATVGQLDEDEVFYLRSRGLSEAQSRELLVYAFAAEILEALPVASLREALGTAVSSRLLADRKEEAC